MFDIYTIYPGVDTSFTTKLDHNFDLESSAVNLLQGTQTTGTLYDPIIAIDSGLSITTDFSTVVPIAVVNTDSSTEFNNNFGNINDSGKSAHVIADSVKTSIENNTDYVLSSLTDYTTSLTPTDYDSAAFTGLSTNLNTDYSTLLEYVNKDGSKVIDAMQIAALTGETIDGEILTSVALGTGSVTSSPSAISWKAITGDNSFSTLKTLQECNSTTRSTVDMSYYTTDSTVKFGVLDLSDMSFTFSALIPSASLITNAEMVAGITSYTLTVGTSWRNTCGLTPAGNPFNIYVVRGYYNGNSSWDVLTYGIKVYDKNETDGTLIYERYGEVDERGDPGDDSYAYTDTHYALNNVHGYFVKSGSTVYLYFTWLRDDDDDSSGYEDIDAYIANVRYTDGGTAATSSSFIIGTGDNPDTTDYPNSIGGYFYNDKLYIMTFLKEEQDAAQREDAINFEFGNYSLNTWTPTFSYNWGGGTNEGFSFQYVVNLNSILGYVWQDQADNDWENTLYYHYVGDTSVKNTYLNPNSDSASITWDTNVTPIGLEGQWDVTFDSGSSFNYKTGSSIDLNKDASLTEFSELNSGIKEHYYMDGSTPKIYDFSSSTITPYWGVSSELTFTGISTGITGTPDVMIAGGTPYVAEYCDSLLDYLGGSVTLSDLTESDLKNFFKPTAVPGTIDVKISINDLPISAGTTTDLIILSK